MLTIARLSPGCWRDPGSLNNNLYSLLIPGRWPPVVGTRSRHILILEIFLFSSVFWPPLVTKHVSPGYLLSRSITILLKTTGDMRRPAPGGGNDRSRSLSADFLFRLHSAEYGSSGSGAQIYVSDSRSRNYCVDAIIIIQEEWCQCLQLGHTPSYQGVESRTVASWCCWRRRWCRSRRDADGAICPPRGSCQCRELDTSAVFHILWMFFVCCCVAWRRKFKCSNV